MPNSDKNLTARLEQYLDGQLAPAEAAELEAMLESRPDVMETVRLQRALDQSLQRQFRRDADTDQGAADTALRAVIPVDRSRGPAAVASRFAMPGRRSVWVAGLAALVALVAWLAVGRQWLDRSSETTVAFVPRSLEAIYMEEVERGFQEYWDCDEPPRFAATFYLRHGQALRLRPLPAGSRMKGLSYLAGLSRETTAMLAMVDDSPVLVFIDDLRQDHPLPPPDGPEFVQLHRFRQELGRLVLYEVTPLDVPHVMPYLEQVDVPQDYLDQLPARGSSSAPNRIP